MIFLSSIVTANKYMSPFGVALAHGCNKVEGINVTTLSSFGRARMWCTDDAT